jgi:hypothetical protein
MAAGFTSWTVLPHKPIEKLGSNLWRVNGTMSDGKVQRQMVLARLDDGRVIVHNAIALEPAEMAELEAWGEIAAIFVPNGFHRQDALIWKQRYPKAKVYAPSGSAKRVAKLVPVDGTAEDVPHDAHVRITPMAGMPSEAVLEVTTDGKKSLTFCDAILNMRKLGGPIGFFLAPTGEVSVPRAARWLGLKDKKAFTQHLEGLAGDGNLSRLMFGHGEPVTENPADSLRHVIQQIRG